MAGILCRENPTESGERSHLYIVVKAVISLLDFSNKVYTLFGMNYTVFMFGLQFECFIFILSLRA